MTWGVMLLIMSMNILKLNNIYLLINLFSRTSLCELKPKDMKEFGVYNMTIYENGTCAWNIDKEGVEVYYCKYIPLLLIS